MSQFIEQLESRELCSTTSLRNPAYLDIKPQDSVTTGQLNVVHKQQIYMVRVTKPGTINLRLEGLTGDAALELISDRNYNNRLDSGEVIGLLGTMRRPIVLFSSPRHPGAEERSE